MNQSLGQPNSAEENLRLGIQSDGFPVYTIKSLDDFQKVPQHRREAMLVDFLTFLRLLDEKKLRNQLLSALPFVKLDHVFHWKDDGAHEATSRLTIVSPDGQRHSVNAACDADVLTAVEQAVSKPRPR